MGDLPENMAKDVKKFPAPASPRKSKRWTLLLLGDYGKTISIRWFRELSILAVILFFIGATAAVYLVIDLKNTKADNRKLKNTLNENIKKVAYLREEKDKLMVRLVLADSRAKGKKNGTKKLKTDKPSDKSANKPADRIEVTETKIEKDDGSNQQVKPLFQAPEESDQAVKNVYVAAENFTASFIPLIKQLAADNPCAARKPSFSFLTTQSFPGSSGS